MPHLIPDLQFGLSEEELCVARKALGVAEGQPLTLQQLRAWQLTKDTYLGNLSERCSRVSDRAQVVERPVVQTKRTVARWREPTVPNRSN